MDSDLLPSGSWRRLDNKWRVNPRSVRSAATQKYKLVVVCVCIIVSLPLCLLFLGIAYTISSGGLPNTGCLRAGGAFGIIAAFLAW